MLSTIVEPTDRTDDHATHGHQTIINPSQLILSVSTESYKNKQEIIT